MKALSQLKKYSVKTKELDFYPITDEYMDKIPNDIGIYIFKNKRNGKIDYVGTATGKKGLRQRVKNQHLNPKYIKSVFRLKIANDKNKDKKDESANFIKSNYKLALLPVLEHVSVIMALEQVLIYEYLPKYNSETTKT